MRDARAVVEKQRWRQAKAESLVWNFEQIGSSRRRQGNGEVGNAQGFRRPPFPLLLSLSHTAGADHSRELLGMETECYVRSILWPD